MIFSEPVDKSFANSGLILEHIYTFYRDHNSSYSLTKTKNVTPLSACSILDKQDRAFGIYCKGKVGYYRAFPGHRVCWFEGTGGDCSSETHWKD